MNSNKEKTKLILAAIDCYRGLMLDAVQSEIGSHQSWPTVRSRILKALGERGLSQRVQEIMGSAFSVKNGGSNE